MVVCHGFPGLIVVRQRRRRRRHFLNTTSSVHARAHSQTQAARQARRRSLPPDAHTRSLAHSHAPDVHLSITLSRSVGRARTHANTHTHTLTRTIDGNVYGKREWQTFVRTRLRNTPKRARTVASSSGVVVYVVRAPSPRGVKTTRQGKNVTRRTAERYAHYCR